MFVDGADTIRALSGFDFSEFQNVDKMFFEVREGQFTLVYDRTVVEAIKNKQPISNLPSAQLMLQYARYQLGEKKQEAFQIGVKLFGGKKRSEYDLTTDQVKFLKDRIGLIYGPVAYGRFLELIGDLTPVLEE